MSRRMQLVAGAVVGVIVLAGCNKVTLVPTSTYQDGERCMMQSLSADGRWLAYTTLDDPSGQTMPRKTVLQDLRTGTVRELAGSGGHLSYESSVSGDGSRVVLEIPDVSASGTSVKNQLYLWTRGSGRTRITPPAESNSRSAISSDGRKVAYASTEGKLLWLYDIATGTREAIARPDDAGHTVALFVRGMSSTGRFVLLEGTDGNAYVRDTVDGTGWTLPTSGSDLGPVMDISGDGRWVAYSLSRSGSVRSQVSVWDRTTGKATVLTNGGAKVATGQPSIDDDGSHLAYTTADYATGTFSLVTMERATKKTTVVATAKRYFAQPSLAGSGTRGSFCSQATDLVPGDHGVPNLYTWG